MPTPTLGGLRAWTVFLTAGLVYVVAIASRTSFAVAVPQAGARFPGGSSILAMFVVLQLAVYALAQVPVGVLLDRYGSRRVLVTGAVIVAAGQTMLALATSVPVAVVARVLVGAGDATAFIGILRLLPSWFPLGRVPLMSQIVGLIGGLGQIISAVPFLAFLHAKGWTPAFGVMAGCALAFAIVGFAMIRDTPELAQGGRGKRKVKDASLDREPMPSLLAAVIRHPATWLGYFCHWVCMFPSAILTLMWGVSWMTEGLGISAGAASAVITANTVAAALGGLLAGYLSGSYPRMRPTLVLVGACAAVTGWCIGLLWASPIQAAFVGGVILGVTAPLSGIGFDVARSYNQPARWGTCTGVVNTGGFTATIISVELVGVLLDALGGDRSAQDFQIAIGACGFVWLVGVAGLLVTLRATRRYERSGRAHASF